MAIQIVAMKLSCVAAARPSLGRHASYVCTITQAALRSIPAKADADSYLRQPCMFAPKLLTGRALRFDAFYVTVP
jgi:hypothetical protein